MTEDVFSSDTEDQGDVFSDGDTGSVQNNQSVIEELVGEGKKFKDVNALAKGKLESDKFIAQLQRELKELREDLDKGEYTKELISKLQNKATDSGSVSNTGKEADNTKSSVLSEDSVKDLVAKHLSEVEVKRTAEQNIRQASEKLRSVYGEKANQMVATKASELGLSVERLREMAAESPTAFLALVGANEAPKNTGDNIPQNRVNSTNFSNQTDERNFEYYQKLRRENKRLYHSPEVQKQMWKDMERLGPRFGA